MAGANWGDLANTKVGDVKPPVNIPEGHYQAIITGMGEVGKSSQKGTLYIKFPIKLQEPMANVDTDELAASDGLAGRDKDTLTFYLTANSTYRFTDFGKGIVGNQAEDMTIPELAEALATSNEPFQIEARLEPSQRDPERMILRLDNPTPISAG